MGSASNERTVTPDAGTPERLVDLEALYREHHGFVWRTLYHFGLRDEQVNDATQEVFITVHRRLGTFDGRTSVKNWLYGIVRRVASDHRKKNQRVRARLRLVPPPEQDTRQPSMHDRAAAVDLVTQLLETLDEPKREVFVLAEVEGMTAPEIAQAIGANLNTVYSRLRAARLHFRRETQRLRARDDRRHA